ncbi:MAG: 23S rRNA (uracil-C(5))-methyltransferase RlmCD [Chlamydiae bacterium]|nr:23S rRNA (uracil-C(5))-methyltransferase RlmCD [Chlamydiota bacterium]
MPLQLNQKIEIPIHRLGVSGEGVGDFESFTMFVDGALPGEIILGIVTEIRKNFGRAKILEITKSSPHRVKPICPLFGRCGGCQIMHLEYEKQLEAKRQRILDALQRIGKLEVEVNPCHPSPMPLAYRNKIQLPVKEGKIGLYTKGSHEVIDVEKCYIHCSLGEKVYEWIRSFPEVQKFQHLLIRTAVKTGEVLLVFVTEEAFIPQDIPPEVKGIVQCINRSKGNRILGQEFRTLWGREWIKEILHGLQFRISAASFFQINPFQAENLYSQVVDFAELTGNEIVLDSYCGVGTLALILAKGAKKIIGVESVPESIEDAKANAKLNKIENVEFFCERAEEFRPTLDKVDVAVVNPPRKGCEQNFLEVLAKIRPKRIVYVSCDPATMARDVSFLVSQGYRVSQIQPFDMFPQTSHVECVVQLKLRHL